LSTSAAGDTRWTYEAGNSISGGSTIIGNIVYFATLQNTATTGLDITSRNELWEMIRELVNEGTTVLLTTQYLEEADRLAGRIAVVDEGRVIANDTPEALKSQLGSTVVEMDVRGNGRAQDAVAVLSGRLSDRVEHEGERIRITSEGGADVLIQALRILDEQGMAPDALTVREPSLDDVFLALTGHHAEDKQEDKQPELATSKGGAA